MFLRAKIRYSLSAQLRVSRGPAAAFCLGALLAATAAQAQQVPIPAPASAAAPAVTAEQPTYRNAIRFDLGGIVISNLVNGLLNTRPETLVPVLVSYERQLTPRFSVVAEGLLNGGTSDERKAGLGVQGRYYLLPTRNRASLTGLYVAPVLSYRAVGLRGYRQPDTKQRFAGVGTMVGWQLAASRGSRLFLDASLGLMAWQQLGKNKVAGEMPPGYYTPDSYYERTPVTIDGRLGIGFKF
ncbi:hypothetical protein LGH70_13720 [Hymenobacter sp. BT635]|uniref:DUF3575 domain-containing protein n=1 Tax=Hymenobacter nitidus TaxID=2880929 RepID=A0ABS8AI35_9BACT|nr:hypothetical protein [Hymenobacter nitidus]MCB2378654.1 hypothetical protein [Hymenobacter nitidus]